MNHILRMNIAEAIEDLLCIDLDHSLRNRLILFDDDIQVNALDKLHGDAEKIEVVALDA